MEYKEVTTKSGKHIVFCDFQELLMEAYGVKTFEEVIPYANSNGEYIIHCPFCKAEGHTKHKLYIKDDLTVGHCFVCTRNYINVSDDIDLSFTIPKSLTEFGYGKEPFHIITLDENPDWSIERFEYEFDDYDEAGYRYLLGRHKYMADLYKVLGIKFWEGNAVIPFKHDGQVFYYQIRFSNPGAKIKYFMPHISKKPPFIIERGEQYKHRIVIVEGIFDAIAALIQCPDYTPIAVLGSSISDYQLDFIRDYCGYLEEIRIWMDETKISVRIADRVKSVIDYCPISIIKSKGDDPEEIMKSRMRRNPGSEIGWIKPLKTKIQ